MTLFRKRMGFVPDGPPILDAVPQRVRVGLMHIVGDRLDVFGTHSDWNGVYDHLLRASRRNTLESGSGRPRVELLLAKCDWIEVYEIVEYFAVKYRKYDRAASSYANAHTFDSFRAELNTLLGDESVGYGLDADGKLQMTASQEMVEAAASALGATQEGMYAASAAQLRRSLEKLTFRKLDPTNAVKDAVGALEGVVRVRLGAKGDIGDNSARLRELLHPTLAGAVESLVKVEAYRGDMAAHSDKPGRVVTVEEAIFVVHICSAAIALLASSSVEE